jgi:hypothetical protein
VQQAYKADTEFLAIYVLKDRMRLEAGVQNSINLPGLLVGLYLEDHMHTGDIKNLRRRVIRRLQPWSEDGGFVAKAATLAPEFYSLLRNQEGVMLEYIITRLEMSCDNKDAVPFPKKKKQKAAPAVKVREI